MGDKVRIRFAKTGAARFLSHHDLLRAFERMLRRAGLPFRSTEGFHPKPKMAFASALGLGIEGREEVVEIELAEPIPENEVKERLAAQAISGLTIHGVRLVPRRAVARPIRATYRLLTASAEDSARQLDAALMEASIANLLSERELWVERERPSRKRFDLRPYLLHLAMDPDGLTMTLAITPTGAARPEEVLTLLGLGDLLRAGARLERSRLELADESEPFSADVGPVGANGATAATRAAAEAITKGP